MKNKSREMKKLKRNLQENKENFLPPIPSKNDSLREYFILLISKN